MFVLAQEQEVLTDLVLGECGRVTLKVFSQLADVADVFLFGGHNLGKTGVAIQGYDPVAFIRYNIFPS